MAGYLLMIACVACGYEHYFEPDSMPGGDEHCPYCEVCGTSLPCGTGGVGRGVITPYAAVLHEYTPMSDIRGCAT